MGFITTIALAYMLKTVVQSHQAGKIQQGAGGGAAGGGGQQQAYGGQQAYGQQQPYGQQAYGGQQTYPQGTGGYGGSNQSFYGTGQPQQQQPQQPGYGGGYPSQGGSSGYGTAAMAGVVGAAGGYAASQYFNGGQQQQAYAAPPPAAGPDPNKVAAVLHRCIQEQRIQEFYRDPRQVEVLAQRIVASGALQQLSTGWNIPPQLVYDLSKIALFDVVFLLDDSGSMRFAQNGERIEDLKAILGKAATACSMFDQDGFSIRFLNSDRQGNNIVSDQQVISLLQGVKFEGTTPLGTMLEKKVLKPLVLDPAKHGTLRKPVLVIAITDGEPYGESRDKTADAIIHAKKHLERTKYGADAVSFSFAQVGNDAAAQRFLSSLDNDPKIGGLIDQTMEFDQEAAEVRQKLNGFELTPELWLLKLLLGGIDVAYDMKDERR